METIHTIGRRKASVARIYMSKGKGNITVNGKDFKEYFPVDTMQFKLEQPFKISDLVGKFDVKVNNFLRFAMDNFDTELVVMGIKLALTQYALPIDPDEVDCFDEFHERFGKYIKAAQSS